jgi:hypothetical protein
MLAINENYLDTYAEKARQLEAQISQTYTSSKLTELAQEAATYHRILSAYLMSKDQPNKKVLAELLLKFSQIETDVLIKFYKSANNTRGSSVL